MLRNLNTFLNRSVPKNLCGTSWPTDWQSFKRSKFMAKFKVFRQVCGQTDRHKIIQTMTNYFTMTGLTVERNQSTWRKPINPTLWPPTISHANAKDQTRWRGAGQTLIFEPVKQAENNMQPIIRFCEHQNMRSHPRAVFLCFLSHLRHLSLDGVQVRLVCLLHCK